MKVDLLFCFFLICTSYSGLIVGTDGDKLGGTRNRSRPISGDGGGTAGTYALLQLPGEFLVWHEVSGVS